MEEDETSMLAVLNGERELVKGEAARLQNHLRALLRQVDPVYERGLRSLTTKRALAELQGYADGGEGGLTKEARVAAIRRLGRLLETTVGHLRAIGEEMEALAAKRFGELTRICGVDRLTAAQLAAQMGPGQRFASDAALASWSGTAPLEASSGGLIRHRLSRLGNRQFNAIVHRIAVTQMRYSEQARPYIERRRAEGKTRREAMRALKRYIVRAIFARWTTCFPLSPRLGPSPLTPQVCT
jgi:transposase